MAQRDPGLQPERTRLAWRRTLLALTTVALAGLRLLPVAVGPGGVVPPALALLGVAALWWSARRRSRHVDGALADERGLPGGGSTALMALTSGVVAVSGLLFVLAG